MNWSDAEKKEKRHQEDLDRLRSFRPMDDTFMRGLFKENLPLAELVLRIITGKPDLSLPESFYQFPTFRSRSLAVDSNGFHTMQADCDISDLHQRVAFHVLFP